MEKNGDKENINQKKKQSKKQKAAGSKESSESPGGGYRVGQREVGGRDPK